MVGLDHVIRLLDWMMSWCTDMMRLVSGQDCRQPPGAFYIYDMYICTCISFIEIYLRIYTYMLSSLLQVHLVIYAPRKSVCDVYCGRHGPVLHTLQCGANCRRGSSLCCIAQWLRKIS